MSFAYFPQAWRIWKLKRGDDVSLSSFSIFAVGTTTLTLYGFYKNDLVIILSFIIGVVGSWLVLFLALYYRNRKGL